ISRQNAEEVPPAPGRGKVPDQRRGKAKRGNAGRPQTLMPSGDGWHLNTCRHRVLPTTEGAVAFASGLSCFISDGAAAARRCTIQPQEMNCQETVKICFEMSRMCDNQQPRSQRRGLTLSKEGLTFYSQRFRDHLASQATTLFPKTRR